MLFVFIYPTYLDSPGSTFWYEEPVFGVSWPPHPSELGGHELIHVTWQAGKRWGDTHPAFNTTTTTFVQQLFQIELLLLPQSWRPSGWLWTRQDKTEGPDKTGGPEKTGGPDKPEGSDTKGGPDKTGGADKTGGPDKTRRKDLTRRENQRRREDQTSQKDLTGKEDQTCTCNVFCC